MQFRYITNRTLLNSAGKENGRIRVFVRVNSEKAEVDYNCPECSNSEHIEKQWKKPFSVKCSKCGTLLRVSKLKKKS